MPINLRAKKIALWAGGLFGAAIICLAALAISMPCGLLMYCEPETATNPVMLQLRNPTVRASFYLGSPTAVLLDPLNWSPHEPLQQRYRGLSIPRGFITDFASIPPFYIT